MCVFIEAIGCFLMREKRDMPGGRWQVALTLICAMY